MAELNARPGDNSCCPALPRKPVYVTVFITQYCTVDFCSNSSLDLSCIIYMYLYVDFGEHLNYFWLIPVETAHQTNMTII